MARRSAKSFNLREVQTANESIEQPSYHQKPAIAGDEPQPLPAPHEGNQETVIFGDEPSTLKPALPSLIEKHLKLSINAYTLEDLESLSALIEEELITRRAAQREILLAQVNVAAAAAGQDLHTYLGLAAPAGAAPRRSQRKCYIAYRAAPDFYWSGRGPRPKWLRDLIAAGHTLEEFAVQA